MLDRQIQIEKEIDMLLDSDLDPDRLNDLIDELEEILATKEDYYKLRIVK